MEKDQKEKMVAELTEKLRATDTLIVADYRGLTNKELEALRARLVEHGARFSIVKNTLTRRAAEAAGVDILLTMLKGPTAIAFIESDGDPAAVAKAMADTAREAKVLTVRGGVLQGAPMSGEQVEELAKLPPTDILRAQLIGVVVAPLTQLVSLLAAPLRDLVGLIDARIEQLGDSAVADSPNEEEAGASDDEAVAQVEPTAADSESPVAESAEAESAPSEEE